MALRGLGSMFIINDIWDEQIETSARFHAASVDAAILISLLRQGIQLTRIILDRLR